MAKDLYGLTDSGIAPELQAEYRGLTRNQAIQEAMLQQSMQAPGGLIDAGRYKVARSPLEGLGKVAQAYMARQGLNETDKKFAELGDRQRQLQIDAAQQYQRTAQDRTVSVPNVGAMTGSMDEQDAPRQNETVKGDPRKALVELLSSQYAPKNMQSLAMADYTRQRDQEYEAAQAAETMKALGLGPNAAPVAGQPQAQIMPLPNTGQEGGPQTSFAGPRTDILAQLNSIKDPQEKAAALQAFQAQDMSQRGTTQAPANAAVVAAMMSGKAAARIAPILSAQQKQAADLADKQAGRTEMGDLRRDIAGQSSADRRAIADQVEQTRRDLAAQNDGLRRELAGSRTANKAPPGYRFTADGNMEVIPGGPADVKASAIAQRQADGSNDVDVSLGTLRDAYSRLETGGGITSTNKGALDNAGAALSSSAVGQLGGKIVGSKNQSARNDIAMARPGLLSALMKATGMSAKQMDSNAELKLWLSTATDPTLDVESNRKALENIERKYLKKGSGGAKTIVREVTLKDGRIGVEYSDGTRGFK